MKLVWSVRHFNGIWTLLVLLTTLLIVFIPDMVISEKLNNFNNDNESDEKQLIITNDKEIDGLYDHIDNFFISNGISQIDDFQITNLVLTSDIEGNLNAVNRKTGELLWSLIGGQPLVTIKSDSDNSDLEFTTPVSSPTHKIHNHLNFNSNRYNDPTSPKSSQTISNKNNKNNNNYNNNNNKKHINNHKRNDITWIVEPYGDGTIYHFMGNEGLEKLPISIKQFVLNSPFSIDNEFVYTGSRISGIVKINARTGAIVESFGLETKGKCSTYTSDFHNEETIKNKGKIKKEKEDSEIENENTSEIIDDDQYGDQYNNDFNNDFDIETDYYGSHGYNSKENEVGPFITLGKTIYELTIHSKNNTSWNITYVQWGPNNLHSNLIDQNLQSADDIYIQPFHDSSLLALDSDSKSIKWVSNLPYVTVNVFDVFANSITDNDYVVLPHPLDHQGSLSSIPGGSNNKQESTYLDRTKEGSWYALSETHYPSLVRSAPIAKYITNERWRLPSIFTNDDLLGISISGVHDNSFRRKEKENIQKNVNNKHLAIYQSATAMSIPEKYNQLIRGDNAKNSNDNENRNRNRNKHRNNKMNRNDNYNVDDDDDDDDYIAFTNSPTLTFKTSSLSQLIYRALENVFVALLCLGMLFVLSRFGLLKGMIGNKQENDIIAHDKSVTIEILPNQEENKVDKEVSTENNKFENDNIDKKVNFIEEKKEKDDKEDIEDTTRRKRKRGSRGGKKNKKKEPIENLVPSTTITSSSNDEDDANILVHSNLDSIIKNPPVVDKNDNLTYISNNLTISDKILGFGSHGTIVFKGFFENRPVAVKRMLLEFYDVASHEINLLQESDDHSNVIRYFCSQEKNKFLYIALELCSASLEDLIEKKKDDLNVDIEVSQILYQIANGVNHLHSLKIVHRDIKPQNILVSLSKKGSNQENSVRFLISDFGLCKKLDADQSSFKGTTANAAGTSGWRAPELLMDTSPAYIESNSLNRVRLTKSVDVFSAGCVFFYILTGGYHPFGDRYIREGNIIKGEYDLSKLNTLPEAFIIKDLISGMIQKNPLLRPDIKSIMKHPYFWSAEKKLEFLLKVSDRFEVEKRDPPSKLLLQLESIALQVIGPKGWFNKFDDKFIDNLGKYRKYNTHKLMDLLRAIRNKYHHYQDLPDDLAAEMGPLPDGFYWYFQRKFPRLLLSVYKLMEEILPDDELLGQFF